MEVKMKLYPIYNLKIAGMLMHQGFVLVQMRKNKKFKQYYVYFFHETDELLEAIKKIN
jgi:hypothetical protein